ncbi:MAG: SPOR domain-containing protein, partial [Bacteroidales bacterium]
APTQKLYNVIVASVGNAEAAQKAAENLIQQGYPHAKAIVGEGKARVSVESFEKEADAYRAIQQYQANGQFEAAWVLRR